MRRTENVCNESSAIEGTNVRDQQCNYCAMSSVPAMDYYGKGLDELMFLIVLHLSPVPPLLYSKKPYLQ
jgi:hypothetical protein